MSALPARSSVLTATLSGWLLSLACVTGTAWAAGAVVTPARDRDAPLLFDAGQMKIDTKRKVRLLTGGVEMTRGSFMLTSQQVELRETAQGGDLAIATSGGGKQAHFRQRREGMDEVIDGQADRIEYDGKTEVVHLIGNAMLKRLRGDVVTEEVSGQTIIYEHAKETFEVQGGGGAGARVKGVVTPQSKPAEGGR